MIRSTAINIATPAAGIAPPSGVVDDDVERAAVVSGGFDCFYDLVLRGQQERHRVEVSGPGVCDRRDPVDARNDAVGRVEHTSQEVHDGRQDDQQHDRYSDPLEDHRGLLSATTAAFLAIPGRAPVITSNWALIALTAGSSGRRCSASTPSRAPASVASPREASSRSTRILVSAPASTITTTSASSTVRITSRVMPHHRTRR